MSEQDKQPVRPRIGAFAPEIAFLPALARLWLAEGGGHEGIIILPNRRAAQALAGAFLQANEDKALLLPRIIALGTIDEAGLSLSAGLTLPPAMDSIRRQALLARLILQKPREDGAPQKLPAAWMLAAEFAALLDEADHAGVDLAKTLPLLVPDDFSEHWKKTLEFLNIVTHAWPDIMAMEGVMNPAERLSRLVEMQARAWALKPPPGKIWMITESGTPAICEMAGIVSRLPQGRLILPGFDPYLDDESWQNLTESHAQEGTARLLAKIGARPDDVELLPACLGDGVSAGRGALFSRALLPASSLAVWQEPTVLALGGVSRLETADEAQNALAIAMVLRDALQVPGQTAALVTPDRSLATRAAAALKRFGITADDSAGEPLATTPPAIFIRLLARAACSDYEPVPLLALLKHPLASGGLSTQAFRDTARKLEMRCLRGPRPPGGLAGLRSRLTDSGAETESQVVYRFLADLEGRLTPLTLPDRVTPVVALTALIQAAEALADTPDAQGALSLWSGESGFALSTFLSHCLAALEDMPQMALRDLPDLFDALISDQVVRRPRTKDGHSRIAIWGVREAALQTVDVMVLGGLVEAVWPSPAEPGPWLSRPMRRQAGLPSPEEKIGQAAHAFFSLACACPQLVLAAPKRRERAPAVPARWLARLTAMLAGQGLELPLHEASGWVAQLDLPVERVRRKKPRPKPPVGKRPKTYSISDVATLMADPYAIYARKVLRLLKLEPLDAESDASQFGDIVHTGLAKFFTAPPNGTAAITGSEVELACLVQALEAAMRETHPREALAQWWRARLERIAVWLLQAEHERMMINGPPRARVLECKGEFHMAGGFVLKGRADRLEQDQDGLIRIIDYKTGSVPSERKVKSGSAPQLPLEAVMAENGAFGEAFEVNVKELLYVTLSGRARAGNEKQILGKADELRSVIEQVGLMLPQLLEKYARPDVAFLASPHPARETGYDDYRGISRRAEWGEEGDDVSE